MSIHARHEVARAALAQLNNAKDCLSDEYIVAELAVLHSLTGGQIEQLRQLVETGPVWDGDVVSKTARDDLIVMGFASRVCVKGEQGFTAANYRGWGVLKSADSK